MREIKSPCYQRSFTSRYMKIVLLKVDLNLSCCEGFDFIFFFPDKKELALYLDPWEESLLNFVLSQIYMEFSKSIQSMKKHYFYSHQKPTKLVYEICLIPIVLWGKLKNKFMIFALHRISSIN